MARNLSLDSFATRLLLIVDLTMMNYGMNYEMTIKKILYLLWIRLKCMGFLLMWNGEETSIQLR